ncbi:MAG: hypothetical protein JNL96_23610 [Planctomycetaceae bacterium]|nr:hypothetical protein [Planctomycetaceae bacterium]
MTRRFLFALCAVAASCAPPPPARGETLLFVDDHEVLYRSGTRQVVHPLKKYAQNPVVTPDNPERPWEKSIQWVSVYRDPQSGKLQMWYQAWSGKGAEDKRFKSVVAYAESTDGLNWTKPDLTLFPYRTRGYDVAKSNIVLVGHADGYGDRYSNSVVVRPDEPDPAKRYKLAYYDWDGKPGEAGVAGLCVAFSPDGVQWTKQGDGVIQPTGFGAKTMPPPFADESRYFHLKNPDGREWRQWRYTETLSDAVDALWDARLGRYVIYGKMWVQGPDGGLAWKHGMGRTESADFLHWSKPQLLLTTGEDDPPNLEFHTSPVFLHEGVYFSLNQLFTRENGTIDNELITSRDGLKWDRRFARQTILPRGGKKAFDASFVLTNGNLIEMGDEFWFYYGGNRGLVRFPNPDEPDMSPRATQFGSGVGLATVKRDRFVGIVPDPKASLRNWNPNDPNRKPEPKANKIGQVTLRPRDLSNVKRITINADAARGSLRLEVLDEDGYRVRGFTKDDFRPLTADALAHEAAWQEKSLADLPAGRYHLRAHLDGAELFALTLLE